MNGRENLFQQAMSQGHSAAWDQMWDRAASFYKKALEYVPDQPQALTNLGLAMYELQHFEEALRWYARAAAVTPEDPMPLEKVAQLSERIGEIDRAAKAALSAAELYLKKREIEKAIENWTRVIRLNPESVIAHSRLALVYEKLGRKQQSVTEYLAIASLMQHSGDMEKAVQTVNHALQVLPGSTEAHQALAALRDFKPLPRPARTRGATGPLRMQQVRQMETSASQEQASGVDPIGEARQVALSVLAGLLFEQGDETPDTEQSTRRGLQAIVRGAASPFAVKQADRTKIMLHVSQAVDLQTRGQIDQAADELERATEAGLEHSAAMFDIGLLRSQGAHYESAARRLQKAVKHSDYALASRLLLGQIYRKMNRIDEATVEYLEALKLADSQLVPEDKADELRQLYEPLIEAESQQSDRETKTRLCDNIIRLLEQPDWRTRLAQARQNLPVDTKDGPPMPLGEILTAARSSQIIESISTIHQLARSGQLRSAMEEAFYAVQFAPTYLPLHIYMGELLLQQDRLTEAINKFTVIAQAYNSRGEAKRAVDLFHRIIQLAPMDLSARSRLIDLLIARGQTDQAINEYLELADVYYSMADLAKARKTYTEALRLAQQSNVDRAIKVQILHQMADIDLQSLDWRQALRVYEQIRTLQPDDQRARSSLIELNIRLGQEAQALTELNNFMSYLTSSGQREEIVLFLEELEREIPNQVIIRRHLAEAYRQVGRIAEAINELDTLGEMLLDAGDKAAAAEVIESILVLNPQNREQYRRLLTQIKGN
jgi:tetratricopeptide (TPR) repeat protein